MKFRNNRLIILAGILALTLMLVVYQVRLLEASSPADPAQNEIPCEEGMAGIYPCERVDFLSFMGLDELGTMNGSTAANLWGWTDSQTDKEYVLLGMTDTLAVLDVSYE